MTGSTFGKWVGIPYQRFRFRDEHQLHHKYRLLVCGPCKKFRHKHRATRKAFIYCVAYCTARPQPCGVP